MKKIMKLALIVAIASFATVANAQTFTAGGNTTNVVSWMDSSHVDFVTVGAIMPYRTTSVATNFDTWKEHVEHAFGTTTLSPLPTFSLQWYVNNAPVDGATTENIYLTWNTVGEFQLEARTNILLGGDNVGCNEAVSGKTVFVVPQPTIVLRANEDNGHRKILGCEDKEWTVRFTARGIGARSVKYTVTKMPLSGIEDVEAEVTTPRVGNALVAGSTMFTGSTSFASVEDLYSLSNSVGLETIAINIPGLDPGYVYTVEITGVSDQISRKSLVGDNRDGFVTPPSRVFASFAVLPEPTSTKIDHVTNAGH